ncbi:hypothetical protein NGM33_28670 [Nocardiopsis dassonvillei]|uniref:hypothetical protein n=1 Tax=Nocardiopsis dassonvillei TaxID=2014 RepID=UPI0020A43A28|nr:hypothetical protein [Nocardiopsis dassonvillei]MCP3017311.1 hypothetical protein [Nocardiopsis dassonvillei]
MTPAERELQTAVRRLTKIVEDQGREIRTLKTSRRAPQLGHSSIDSGALEVRDPETQATRMRIGWVNGEAGISYEGGSSVSSPSAPSVTPSLGGLRVTWDGTLSGDVAIPVDFDHMAVHVSTTSGFTPSAATYVGSIRRAGEGGMLPVVPLPYVEHYVVLVPVTTGGVQGVPSAEVAATPLQVDGADLTAGSVTAPIIAGGAVTADKLEAVLVLASTIIAGIPGAARVELDQDGLRGYNASNELIFAIDSTGNAVFSGDIVASEITGSRMVIGSGTGNIGIIDDSGGIVSARVTAANQARAQLAATNTQAEFTAWGDVSSPTTPVGGIIAASGICQLTLRSDASDLATKPVMSLSALTNQTYFSSRSGSGSEIVIQSLPDYSSILLTAPPATDPDDAQGAGHIFTQRLSSDVAAVSMQSPVWSAGSGPERGLRAMLHAEGARPDRTHTRMAYSASRHYFQGQYKDTTSSIDTADGVVEVAATHSILATRHQPIRSDLVTNPSFGTTAAFVDFTSGQWAPITFKTGWSGKVRITITAAGSNSASTGSALDLGFSLAGGSSVPASRSRSWIAIGGTISHSSRVLHLNLAGNTSYTLTPAWRISSGSSSTASFVTAFENSFVVEPLM